MSHKFNCKRCGECCKGSPKLSNEDIKRILELGVNEKVFIEVINGVNYMKMLNDQCVFLGKQEDELTYCKIYAARPKICRLYPKEKVEDCKPEKSFFDEYLEKKRNEENR